MVGGGGGSSLRCLAVSSSSSCLSPKLNAALRRCCYASMQDGWVWRRVGEVFLVATARQRSGRRSSAQLSPTNLVPRSACIRTRTAEQMRRGSGGRGLSARRPHVSGGLEHEGIDPATVRWDQGCVAPEPPCFQRWWPVWTPSLVASSPGSQASTRTALSRSSGCWRTLVV